MGTRLWLCALEEETVQRLIKDPSRLEAAIDRKIARVVVTIEYGIEH